MEKKGSELDFISFIKRDGTGTVMIGGEWYPHMEHPKIDNMSYLDDDIFSIKCLSLTEKTFIASGFNSFVVKLKPIEIAAPVIFTHGDNCNKIRTACQSCIDKFDEYLKQQRV